MMMIKDKSVMILVIISFKFSTIVSKFNEKKNVTCDCLSHVRTASDKMYISQQPLPLPTFSFFSHLCNKLLLVLDLN